MTPDELRKWADTYMAWENESHTFLHAAADAWEAMEKELTAIAVSASQEAIDLRKQVEALERAVDFYADLAPAPGGDRP